MPATNDDSQRNRRTAKRILAIGLPLVVIAGTGIGYAYFTGGTGTGTGSATAGSTVTWSVTGTGGAGTNPSTPATSFLYPGGATVPLTYRIVNTGSGHEGLTSVTVTVVATTGASPDIIDTTNTAILGCKAAWFTPGTSSFAASDNSAITGLPVDVPNGANGYVTGTTQLSMVNTTNLAQDACQGKTPQFTVTVG
jgi:hypothetical protein